MQKAIFSTHACLTPPLRNKKKSHLTSVVFFLSQTLNQMEESQSSNPDFSCFFFMNFQVTTDTFVVSPTPRRALLLSLVATTSERGFGIAKEYRTTITTAI